MGKMLLGAFLLLVIIGVAYGGLLASDRLGLVKKEELILEGVSRITGLKNFKHNYELGQKQSTLLEIEKAELQRMEKRLAAREKKLQAEYAELESQKKLWMSTRKQTPSTAVARVKNNSVEVNQDPAVKNFLATLGAMKPEKAAAVIQKLPAGIVFIIFEQLRNNQVAKLMENLPADFLTQLTQERMLQAKP